MDSKALAVLERIEKQHRQLGELIAELAALATASATPGQTAKRLLDGFVTEWQLRHGGQKYVVNGARDMAIIKRLLKNLPAEQIERRYMRFLASRDPFFVQGRHTLQVFAGCINRLGDDPDTDLLDMPAFNCKHVPPCDNDETHTRRTLAEVRQLRR